jgi:hypothetical protein
VDLFFIGVDLVGQFPGFSVLKILRRAGEILRHAVLRRDDDRRRIKRHFRLRRLRSGLRRP